MGVIPARRGVGRFAIHCDSVALRYFPQNMFLLALASGCLIDDATYQRRKAELTDHDGDSFAQEDDCDDTESTIYPGATELCDDVDQDCDGEIADGQQDAPLWFQDLDGDGYGDAQIAGVPACDAPTNTAASAGDCDDEWAGVNPAAVEVPYDGVDNDCDGTDLDDVDGDGEESTAVGGEDCHDGDATIYAGADEGWFDNGVDNDCDGESFDPIAWAAATALTRIDGSAAGGEMGRRLHYWAAGECIIANAPYAESGTGSVYGIAAGEQGVRSVGSAGAATGSLSGSLLTSTDVGDDGRVVTAQVLDGDGEGTVFVLDGTNLCAGQSGSVETLSDWTVQGDETFGWFGSEAEWLGDVDGDGLQDLAVVAPGTSGGGTLRGSVYIWMSPTEDGVTGSSSADLILTGSADGAELAHVTTALDDDGPGVPWLLLDQMVSVSGSAGLFLVDVQTAVSGSVSAASSSGLVTGSTGRHFSSVNVGDTDFDGADDVITGVWSFGVWNVSDLTGFRDETEATNFLTYDVEGEWITSVVPVGDYDGDSRADLAILAEDWSQFTERGQLALVPGERKFGDIIDFTSVQLTAQGSSDGDSFGFHAVPVGDFDADGVRDLAVSAPGADYAVAGGGAIYLLPLP